MTIINTTSTTFIHKKRHASGSCEFQYKIG